MSSDTSPASAGTRGLWQQGYDHTPEELRELEWGLRFTPTVCMLGAIAGLALREPRVHLALAALGILPFWFPAWHPVDRLYDHLLRPLWNGVRLPPNPLPRRIACFMGGAMNLGIGLAFLGGQVALAYVLGLLLIALQLIVISTHFCLASWMVERALRLVGRWHEPVDVAAAAAIVRGGGTLVDVRTPAEYAAGHLPGAVNVPVDDLERRAGELREGEVVVYCRSGLRSRRAAVLLARFGCARVHDLGAMSRWGGTREA